ncbi:Protein-tyrosine kinase 2-beta, partial [Stegodyphus mimosarum]
MLRKETKVTHLQEFLSQCDKILFWQHDAIISTIGMVLTNPTALIMEWLPMGTLDKYLQTHENKLRQVDLVEAAYHIARALWYLEEQQCCHGSIRCHNIMVASHTDNSFKVKLADPGVISYSDADIHWIPPECYNDYSRAASSTAADVYAFGTTLWEIFSYGAKPFSNLSPKEAKELYQKGSSLGSPPGCHKEIEKLIFECWIVDQDSRKRPQTIVRDVNQ